MFICFEGVAGTGKTTQTKLLANYFRTALALRVLVSSIYEGRRRMAVARLIRDLDIRENERATMFLFQALHAVQYHEVKKALQARKIVIADRWRHSFFAHFTQQKLFVGKNEFMQELDSFVYQSLEPDICFLLDVPPVEAFARYIKRERKINDGGLKPVDFNYFVHVTNHYRKLGREKNWCTIDASKNAQSVFQEVKSHLNSMICS